MVPIDRRRMRTISPTSRIPPNNWPIKRAIKEIVRGGYKSGKIAKMFPSRGVIVPKLPINFPVLTRRHFLQIGTVALAGFDLLPMVRATNVKAKEKVKPRGCADYCVFVFLQGGASQVDTFDFKEGRWTPPNFDARTVKPGVRLPTGLFPNLAEKLDRVAIVRSLEAWETEHGRATYYLHVAHPVSPARAREMPALGAVVAYEFWDKRKATDFLPPFVSMNYGPGQVKEGCLDSRFTPLNLDTRSDLSFVVPEQERGRLSRRAGYLSAMSALSSGINSPTGQQLETFRSDALTMMQSAEIPRLLKLKEDEKKRYGGTPFGDACLLARNMLSAEAGTRFIAISLPGWDHHLNIYDPNEKSNHIVLSRTLDAGLSAFIEDLEGVKNAEGRSLLDRTLIVCMGEFGRTTGDLTPGKGRDHHRFAMSGLFAGAGIVGGRALGATDELGAHVVNSGWAKKRSIYPEDVGATIYSALGIDWTKEITNTPSGRAFQYVEFQSGTDFLDVSEIAELFG